jgi:hypothetical protein
LVAGGHGILPCGTVDTRRNGSFKTAHSKRSLPVTV